MPYVRPPYATFGDNVDLSGATLGGNADLAVATFGDSANLSASIGTRWGV